MTNGLKLDLPSLDNLFTTEAERQDQAREKVMDIPLNQIEDFPNHPFKIKEDEDMEKITESIKEYGVLSPAIVRPTETGYEMISGHRRKYACALAGKAEIPCIVRDLTDDEATILMVDSNLQRERILPSEKAFAYKMKLEALKHQGKRMDLTCAPVEHKLKGIKSRDLIAEEMGESKSQIQRYIRLTNLIDPILELIDTNKIAFRPAVELSYLNETEQEALLDMMAYEDCTPSLSQAVKMKNFAKEGKLNEDVILSILQEEKPNQVEKFKIPKEKISKFFKPGTPQEKMEETIVKALAFYRKRQREQQMER